MVLANAHLVQSEFIADSNFYLNFLRLFGST